MSPTGQCFPLPADRFNLPLPAFGLCAEETLGIGRSALRIAAEVATKRVLLSCWQREAHLAPFAYGPQSWGKHSTRQKDHLAYSVTLLEGPLQ